jgi:hypothetical protein
MPDRATDFRLGQIAADACWRIGDVLLLGRGRKGVGGRDYGVRCRDDPHRDEVVQTVIADADDLVRLGMESLEFGVVDV